MPEPGDRYAFGVFDLFHIGHLDHLRRAAGDGRVVAGVATDDLVERLSGHRPFVPQSERLEIVGALRCVARVLPLGTEDLAAHVLAAGVGTVCLPADDEDAVQTGLDADGLLAGTGIAVVRLTGLRETASSAVRAALDRTTSRSSVA